MPLVSCKILQLFNCFGIVPPEDYWNSFLKNEYTFYMKLLRIQFFYKKHIFTYHQCHVNCEFFSNEVVNKENKSHKYVSSYFYSLWYIYTLKTYKKCSLKYQHDYNLHALPSVILHHHAHHFKKCRSQIRFVVMRQQTIIVNLI